MSVLERQEIFDTILKFQNLILHKSTAGCDIKQHCKPFLPESKVKVNHVHFHLLPREFEDDLYLKAQKGENELWEDLSDQEIQEVMNTLSISL